MGSSFGSSCERADARAHDVSGRTPARCVAPKHPSTRSPVLPSAIPSEARGSFTDPDSWFDLLVGMAKNWAMELEARGFGEAEGAVCMEHLVDPALAQRLQEAMTESACTFCNRQGDPEADSPFAVPFEDLMVVIVEAVRHFYSDADAVLPWDSEDHELVGPQSDTWEVVDDLSAGAFADDYSDAITAKVIEAIGDDTMWTGWYSAADLDDLDYAWDQFSQTARHQSRLVIGVGDPSDPPARMASFLAGLMVYASADLGLVVDMPVGTPLYRGRLCEDPSKLKRSSDDLGPAPEGQASANRMSPAGIALFYASADPQTAIAEIAGHGVEPFAVVGQFTNLRAFRVLDLTRQPEPISPFDLDKREHARMARFLRSFVHYVTAPVIPDGRQHVEYAPTQVLTEYLRWVPAPKLDGIVLPSAQTGDRTYVLFFDRSACRTEGGPDADRPKGMLEIGDRGDEPVISLDPKDVTTYEVRRMYSGVKASHWYSATPP